jgi:hypothetical protein
LPVRRLIGDVEGLDVIDLGVCLVWDPDSGRSERASELVLAALGRTSVDVLPSAAAC